MNSFQHTVMIVAIVVLIICLIAIGVALSGHASSDVFPPVIAQCPDYWEASPSGCINTYNLGYDVGKCKTVPFREGASNCQKQSWARGCNLTWDGITNSEDLCSVSTTSYS